MNSESETQRLPDTLSAAGIGTWEWDFSTGRVTADDLICQFFAVSAAEVAVSTPETWINRIHPTDRSRVEEALNASALHKKPYDVVYRVVWPDGSIRWLEARGNVVTDAEKRPLRLVGTAVDVTDRRETLEALRLSEERLQLATQAANIGTWDYDLLTGALSWDERCREFFGYPAPAPVSYEIFLSGLHPDDRERTHQVVLHCLDLTGDGSYDIEYRTIGLTTGVERWCRATGRVLFEEVEGKRRAYRFIGTIQDITEQHRAEKLHRENEERFRTLADNIPQLAWMADNSGSLFWYNRRWFDYTGTTLDEMLGWGWQKVHHPDYVERVAEKFAQHIQAGEFWEDTFPLRRHDGVYRWFLSRAIPIRNEAGEVLRWFGTNTDITEQREIERELLRRQEEIEALNIRLQRSMAETHHRVKNNLQIITALLEMQTPDENAPHSTAFARVHQHIQALAVLHDLLTQQAKGDMDLSYIPVTGVFDKLLHFPAISYLEPEVGSQASLINCYPC